jgi:hypothetical protein
LIARTGNEDEGSRRTNRPVAAPTEETSAIGT